MQSKKSDRKITMTLMIAGLPSKNKMKKDYMSELVITTKKVFVACSTSKESYITMMDCN